MEPRHRRASHRSTPWQVQAVARELKQELGVTFDEQQECYYLGGWSTGRARDNTINDSFTALAVQLSSADFTTSAEEEDIEARWIEWRPLLNQWREGGKKSLARRWTSSLDGGVCTYTEFNRRPDAPPKPSLGVSCCRHRAGGDAGARHVRGG
jgi:hypothetical protein